MNLIYQLGSLNRGGTEILSLDLFHCVNRDCLNIICLHRKGGDLERDFSQTNVNMIHVSKKIEYIFRLRRLVKQKDIKVIHSHIALDVLLASISTIGLGVKVIFSIHSIANPKNLLTSFLKILAIRLSFLNICVSKAVLSHYQNSVSKSTHEKYRLLYNGINMDKLYDNGIAQLRSEFKIKNTEALLLGSVGNFTSVRDQYFICRFLSLLDNHGIDFHCFFVGGQSSSEPHLFAQCIRYCNDNKLSDRVHFLGVRADIAKILKQLDAFIYASIRDTFGISVIEAMAVGVPVFVNDWKVMLEITGDGEYANIYRSGDEHHLLEYFMDFVASKDEYTIKATNGAKMVNSKFSIERHIRSLKQIYAESIS